MVIFAAYCSASCPTHCLTCAANGTCIQCNDGYGFLGEICSLCQIIGCQQCHGSVFNCSDCAPYHFKVLNEENQAYFCERCSFGCEECSSLEDCTKCANMFLRDSSNYQKCLPNHTILLYIAVGGVFCLMLIVIIVLFATNTTDLEAREIISKLEQRTNNVMPLTRLNKATLRKDEEQILETEQGLVKRKIPKKA